MCLSNWFCGNDCTWAWILFIVGILLLLDNNCGCNDGCNNGRNNGCNTWNNDCGCNDGCSRCC